MTQNAEKRDLLRLPLDCKLTYSVAGSSKEFEGDLINLSSKGILFTSSVKLALGTTLEIVLTPSNSTTPPMQVTVVVDRITGDDVLSEVACKIQEIKD
jgi:PilZ domain